MEDAVLNAQTTDVVQQVESAPQQTTSTPVNTQPVVQETTTVEPSIPTPAPETEIAQNEIHKAREDAYMTQGFGLGNWIKNKYDYNAQEAGTYWVAGAINDVNTQMGFLESFINEDMYGEMDLKKHYFDQNLAIARGYATEKKLETAYGFYRAAQEKALAEAEGTGWYMPPEAGYLLGQWAIAEETLSNPNSSTEEKQKANAIKRTASSWFSANNITERGIKCLNLMYLEETIRHNKESERLQEQAQQIQASANQAELDSNNKIMDFQLRELNFQIAENELDAGYDLNNDNIIGHTGEDAERFGYYKDSKSWIEGNFSIAFNLWGQDHVERILGDEYQSKYNDYQNDISVSNAEKYIEAGNNYIGPDSGVLDNSGLKKKSGDEEIYVAVLDGKSFAGTFKDGSFIPITDENTILTNDMTIKEYLTNRYGDTADFSGINSIEIDGKIYSIGVPDTSSTSPVSPNNISKWTTNKMFTSTMEGEDTIYAVEVLNDLCSEEGFTDDSGNFYNNMTYMGDYADTEGINEFTIVSKEIKDAKGNTDTAYYVVHIEGNKATLEKVAKESLVKLSVKDMLNVGDTTTSYGILNPFGDSTTDLIIKSSWIIDSSEEGLDETKLMVLPHSDGSMEFYTIKRSTTVLGGIESKTQWTVTEVGISAEEVSNRLSKYGSDAVDAFNMGQAIEAPKNSITAKKNENITEQSTPDLDINISDIETNSPDTTINTSSSAKQQSSKKDTSTSRDKGDQIITDIQNQKYVTAFAENEVLKQLQELDAERKREASFLASL